jgi:hypothetical protein
MATTKFIASTGSFANVQPYLGLMQEENVDAPILAGFTCALCGSSRMQYAQINIYGRRMMFCQECGMMRMEVDGVKSTW